MRLFVWVVLAGLLPAATADTTLPTFDLKANLGGSEPLLLRGAVLAVAPRSDIAPAYGGHYWMDPGASAPNEPLAKGDRVDAILYERTESVGLKLPIGDVRVGPVRTQGPVTETVRSFTRGPVQLDLLQIGDRPQLQLVGTNPRESPLMLEGGLDCRVWNPNAPQRMTFPDDPSQVRPQEAPGFDRSKDQLSANCTTGPLAAKGADQIRVYGLTVRLTTPDGPEEIRTGTFNRTDSTGLREERVTQTLVLRRGSGELEAALPASGHVALAASAFYSLGTLQSGPADGRVAWGAWTRSGSLDAFEARGEFTLTSQEGGRLGIDGRTLDAPPRETLGDAVGTARWHPGLLAAAVAIAAGIAAWLLAPFFSRLLPDRLLIHPRRARILEFVRANPGATASDVARSLDLAMNVVVHHIHVLERNKRVTVHRLGGRTALFPANEGYRGREHAVALLRQPTMRLVLEQLRVVGPRDQSALASDLGITQQHVSKCLRALEQAQLVRWHRNGRRKTYACAQGVNGGAPPSPVS